MLYLTTDSDSVKENLVLSSHIPLFLGGISPSFHDISHSTLAGDLQMSMIRKYPACREIQIFPFTDRPIGMRISVGTPSLRLKMREAEGRSEISQCSAFFWILFKEMAFPLY